MSWGSKQTTTSTNANKWSQTPNQSPQVLGIQQGILSKIPGLISEADKPVFGDAQKASFMSNLNDLANASSKHLASTLSGRGQLLSGVGEQGQQGIEQQRLGSLTNFFTQLPYAERQAHLQNLSSALAGGMSVANAVPYGMSGEGSGTSEQTQKSSPGMGALVGGLAGSALSGVMGGLGGGLASGIGGLFGASGGPPGGSFGQNFGYGYGQATGPTGGYGGGYGSYNPWAAQAGAYNQGPPPQTAWVPGQR